MTSLIVKAFEVGSGAGRMAFTGALNSSPTISIDAKCAAVSSYFCVAKAPKLGKFGSPKLVLPA